MLWNGEKIWNIFFCLSSVQFIFYGSLQSFITCIQSVKEFSPLLISHKLLVIAKRSPLPCSLPDLSSPIAITIATQLVVYIKRS